MNQQNGCPLFRNAEVGPIHPDLRHPDRSEAKRRDLLFAQSATTLQARTLFASGHPLHAIGRNPAMWITPLSVYPPYPAALIAMQGNGSQHARFIREEGRNSDEEIPAGSALILLGRDHDVLVAQVLFPPAPCTVTNWFADRETRSSE